MTTANICIILAIVVYLVGMLAIGAANSRRNKTAAENSAPL